MACIEATRGRDGGAAAKTTWRSFLVSGQGGHGGVLVPRVCNESPPKDLCEQGDSGLPANDSSKNKLNTLVID